MERLPESLCGIVVLVHQGEQVIVSGYEVRCGGALDGHLDKWLVVRISIEAKMGRDLAQILADIPQALRTNSIDSRVI